MRRLVVFLLALAVAVTAPAAAFALKSPPPGAPCEIAPKGE